MILSSLLEKFSDHLRATSWWQHKSDKSLNHEVCLTISRSCNQSITVIDTNSLSINRLICQSVVNLVVQSKHHTWQHIFFLDIIRYSAICWMSNVPSKIYNGSGHYTWVLNTNPATSVKWPRCGFLECTCHFWSTIYSIICR